MPCFKHAPEQHSNAAPSGTCMKQSYLFGSSQSNNLSTSIRRWWAIFQINWRMTCLLTGCPPATPYSFRNNRWHFTSKPKPQHNKVSLILCHSHPKKTAYSSSALSLRMPQRELQPLYTVYRTLWSCFMREQWSSVPAFHPTLQIQALASASGLFFGCPSRHTETHRFPSHLQHSGGSPGRKTNWRAWGE